MKRLICVFLILTYISPMAFAQERDLEKELLLAKYNYEKRDPDHAAFWALIPGGGQVYNREYLKAVGMYFLILLSALASVGNSAYASLVLLAWGYSIYDARSTAINYNNELKNKYGLSSLRLLDTSAMNSTL